MTDGKGEQRPRRDADGRLATIGDLLGFALAGLVTGAVVLLVLDGVLALTHVSAFGRTNGWLALILPVWLFTEEFRAAGYGAFRVVAAGMAAGLGLGVGLGLVALVASPVPVLVSGAIGAAGLTVVYCVVWFYGLRWLTHRTG